MVGHGAVGLGVKPLAHGNLVAREAVSDKDVQLSLDLRRRAFIRPSGRKGRPLSDADGFDPIYNHVLIERRGRVVACFRIKVLADPQSLLVSHSGRHYDLGPLSALTGPFADIGRLAVGPGDGDPDILRMVWGMLARLVETHRLRYLLGCTSFAGADPAQHAPALSALCQGHVGPVALLPHRKAGTVVDLTLVKQPPDATRIPPLLRSYLALGAWVSDHAVIDTQLDTLHVFTLLDVASIPPARARVLRRTGAVSTS